MTRRGRHYSDARSLTSSSPALASSPTETMSFSITPPGKVLSILRQVGEHVEAGDAVLVLEAMKMETAVTTSTGGVIEKLIVSVGDDTKAGELLVRLRASD